MRIQHNISAQNSYNKLAGNNNALARNLEKLSSGYKINRAADDAAGLAISEKMRAQITGLTRAQQNSKDAISLVQTAEGALIEVHSMLNRMVDLTTQASNGIYQTDERTKIKDELEQLEEEINRIADSTNFNGIKLLDGTLGSSSAGKTTSAKSALTVSDNLAAKITTVDAQVGSYTTSSTLTVSGLDGAGAKNTFTVNFEDGTSVEMEVELIDAGNNNCKMLINGKDSGLTAAAANSIATASNVADQLVKVINEKLGDKYTAANQTGKLQVTANEAGSSTPKMVDVEITGTDKAGGLVSTAVGLAGFKYGNANLGTAGTAGSDSIAPTNVTDILAFADITVANKLLYDGTNLDDALLTINGQKIVIAKSSTDVSSLDSDINVIIGDPASATASDKTSIAQQLGQVLGMEVKVDSTNAKMLFSGEGAKKGSGMQLQIGDTADSYNQLMVSIDDCHTDSLGIAGISDMVGDAASASEAMENAKAAIEKVSQRRSLLGATQNRLDHTLANLEETTTNLTESESRIRDTDMAEEMMKYTKNNILIQSSQAMLAQANQVPQGVLQLLQ